MDCINTDGLINSSSSKSVGSWVQAVEAKPTLRIRVPPDLCGIWRAIKDSKIHHGAFDRVSGLVLQDSTS
jgi:hypothetical protein